MPELIIIIIIIMNAFAVQLSHELGGLPRQFSTWEVDRACAVCHWTEPVQWSHVCHSVSGKPVRVSWSLHSVCVHRQNGEVARCPTVERRPSTLRYWFVQSLFIHRVPPKL